MKLYCLYTTSYRFLFDEWFRPSLKDSYEIKSRCLGDADESSYMKESWVRAVRHKSEWILDAIRENWGGLFVYADTDMQFFQKTEPYLLKAIEKRDIVCQRDSPKPKEQLCTGFFIARANKAVRKLWEEVRKNISREHRDQYCFNRYLQNPWRFLGLHRCRYGYLPDVFFSGRPPSTHLWKPGDTLPIPKGIICHHANWTVGLENKVAQLNYVRDAVKAAR